MERYRYLFMKDECICRYCGKALSKPFNCKRHELTCKANPNRIVVVVPIRVENLECRHCHKICKNINSLRNHERLCPQNAERHYISYTLGMQAWNKGLTKNTDERVKSRGETYSKRVKAGLIKIAMKGKRHTDETKKKMSEAHKKHWTNGESIFATAREHRRSYPEAYFSTIFSDAKQNYHVLRYYLDFAWPNKKIYVEVDGEQHYTENGLRHDKERDGLLKSAGWECIERIRWKVFKQLNDEQRKLFVNKIIDKIMNFV